MNSKKIRKIFNKINDWYTGVFKMVMWLSRAKKYFPKNSNMFENMAQAQRLYSFGLDTPKQLFRMKYPLSCLEANKIVSLINK